MRNHRKLNDKHGAVDIYVFLGQTVIPRAHMYLYTHSKIYLLLWLNFQFRHHTSRHTHTYTHPLTRCPNGKRDAVNWCFYSIIRKEYGASNSYIAAYHFHRQQNIYTLQKIALCNAIYRRRSVMVKFEFRTATVFV